MSEKTAINICVDSELLTQAGVLFKKFGMDTASAFESLLRQAIKNPELLSSEPVTPETGTPAYKFTKESKEFADQIEQSFRQNGIDVRVIDQISGPVVTTVKIRPAASIASGQIIAASETVANDLGRRKIRVIEVEGADCVGLEIPNPSDSVKPIVLNELVNSEAFEDSEWPLPVLLGKTTVGEPFIFDLVKAPHLLVGGESGSWKSILLNTVIMSLLFKKDPEDLRLVLIDSKGLAFEEYNHNPYLLTPVITDKNKAYDALRWAVKEAEKRFKLMESVDVRNFEELLEKIDYSSMFDRPLMDPISTEEEPIKLKRPPYIIIVINELAELLLSNRKKMETEIVRLTQRAHIAGIHLVMATQHPSVDIVTPLIKSNCPTRIALKVANRYDSTVLINQSGAEDLLGNVDMFFMTPSSPLTRVHGAIIGHEYISGLSAFLWTQLESKYIDLTVEDEEKVPESTDKTDDNAALYDKAVHIVVTERKASISYLQRKLGIEYGRAAKLVGKMEAEGIVSEPTANSRRRVLVGSDYIPNSKN